MTAMKSPYRSLGSTGSQSSRRAKDMEERA
jgi:hypothetical protein